MHPYEPGKAASGPPRPVLPAISRARRARTKNRWLIVVTTIISVVCITATVLVFGLRLSPPEPSSIPIPEGSPSAGVTTAPSASGSTVFWPVRVVVRQNAVLIDGAEIARTDEIAQSGRLTKVDGLFNALRDRRFEHPTDNPTVILEVAKDTQAVVVKSVFQTAAFAGFHDVRFDVDGKILGPRK